MHGTKMLSKILEEVGYDQCIGDEGCFVSTDSGKDCKSVIGTYVDDILGIGPRNMVNNIKIGIEETVELDKWGRPAKMLGLEMTRDNDGKGVSLTQTSLIVSAAEKYLYNSVTVGKNPRRGMVPKR